jgi:4-hydroxy-tetrahydrodipicolinate synthase
MQEGELDLSVRGTEAGGMTLTGLFVPLITPFDGAGAVCHRTLAALAHRVLDDGATGLVALGTTAEPESLTTEERHAVLDTVAAICVERGVPLVVGANTAPVLAALAGWSGVTAALTVVPP